MTENQKSRDDEQAHQLSADQFALVDQLHKANPNALTLESLEEVGLIEQANDEVRAKLNQQLGPHTLNFQRIYQKGKNEGQENKLAYRNAFVAVYGKLIMDQKLKSSHKKDGIVRKLFGKLLKFGDETEERHELESVMFRLDMMNDSRGARGDSRGVNKYKAKVDTLKAEIDELSSDEYVMVANSIPRRSNSSAQEWAGDLKKLDSIESVTTGFEEQIDYNERFELNVSLAKNSNSFNEYASQLYDLREGLMRILTDYEANDENIALSSDIVDLMDIYPLMEKLDHLIDQDRDMDPVELLGLLKHELPTVLKKFDKSLFEKVRGWDQKILLRDDYKVSDLQDMASGLVSRIDTVKLYYKDLNALKDNKLFAQGAIHSSENAKSEADKIIKRIESDVNINELLLPGVIEKFPKIQELISGYITSLDLLKTSNTINAASISVFLERVHKPFLRALDNVVREHEGSLAGSKLRFDRATALSTALGNAEGSNFDSQNRPEAEAARAESVTVRAELDSARAESRPLEDEKNTLLAKKESFSALVAAFDITVKKGPGPVTVPTEDAIPSPPNKNQDTVEDFQKRLIAADSSIAKHRGKIANLLGTQTNPQLAALADQDSPIELADLKKIDSLKEHSPVLFARTLLSIPLGKKLTSDVIYKAAKDRRDEFTPLLTPSNKEPSGKVEAQIEATNEAESELNKFISKPKDSKAKPETVQTLISVHGKLLKAVRSKNLNTDKIAKAEAKAAADAAADSADTGDSTTPAPDTSPNEIVTNREDILAKLKILIDKVTKISNDPSVDLAVKTAADTLLTMYTTDITGDTPPDDDTLETFLELCSDSTVGSFLPSINAGVAITAADSRIAELDSEIAAFGENIRTIESRLAGLDKTVENFDKSPVQRILENAFPGVRFVNGKVMIRGFEVQFGHAGKLVKAAREYFDDPEAVPAVRDSHSKLQSESGWYKDFVKDLDVAVGDKSPRAEVFSKAKLKNSMSLAGQQRALENYITGKRNRVNSLNGKNVLGKDRQKLENDQKDEIINLEDEIAIADAALERLKDISGKTDVLYVNMQKMMKSLGVIEKSQIDLGIEIKDKDGNIISIKDLVDAFDKFDTKSPGFGPDKVLYFYDQLAPYFDDDTKVAELVTKLKLVEKEISANTGPDGEGLTDDKVAIKILMSMISEQNPDMSLREQEKFAKLMLKNDIENLQTNKDYAELAERASAQLLDTSAVAGFRKLLDFKFNDGETVVEPFKGLKATDFSDTDKLMQLFDGGKLDYKAGLIVLAAFEMFSGNVSGEKSAQYESVEKKVFELMAKELGAEDKLHISGIQDSVREAFNDELEGIRPTVRAFFEHHDKNSSGWDQKKVNELETRHKSITKQRREGTISEEIFQKRFSELIDSARDFNVYDKVNFSRDKWMSGWWGGKHAQKFRDGMRTGGKYTGKRAGSAALGVAAVAGRTVWEFEKMAVVAGIGGVVAVPYMAIKYPLLAVGSLCARTANGVRWLRGKQRKDVTSLTAEFKKDIYRAGGLAVEGGKKSGSRIVKSVTTTPGKLWAMSAGLNHKTHEDRDKDTVEGLEKAADELKEKGEVTPYEVTKNPFGSLDKYREQIATAEKMLGSTDAPNSNVEKVSKAA